MTTITAYKAFNPNWTCRGMQYEIGKTYTHEGRVAMCESGLHACECAVDVWSYYPIGCPVAEVRLDATEERVGQDSKRVGKSITITRQLDMAEIIYLSVKWIADRASGDSSTLAASGYNSRLAASGYNSRLAASGYNSRLAASGDSSTLAASGYDSTASAGPNSCICLTWHDGNRPRMTVGYVGEDGIEPNVAYRCDERGKLVRA